MRKLILALIVIFGFTITVSAQQTKTTKKEVKTTKVVTKKDGTPDKRYKETKKTEVVLKKDGTPDKRYTKKK